MLASFPKQLYAFGAGRQSCRLTAQLFGFCDEPSFQRHRLLETTPFDDHRDHPVNHRPPMPFDDHPNIPIAAELHRLVDRTYGVLPVPSPSYVNQPSEKA
jgi:hypothetical protein